MLYTYRLLPVFILLAAWPAARAAALPALFTFPDEESVVVDVAPDDSYDQLLERLAHAAGCEKEDLFLIPASSDSQDPMPLRYFVHRVSKDLEVIQSTEKAICKMTRQFHQEVTLAEKRDIRFILKTLAQKSLVVLWGYKSQLEYAGERIDHLHPLKFLECVFTDEELKVYIHNIKDRGGWVWSEFIHGIKESFQDEQEKGNMKVEYLQEFAQNVGIDISVVYGTVLAHKWEEFIKILITNIPRDGDTGRYDQ